VILKKSDYIEIFNVNFDIFFIVLSIYNFLIYLPSHKKLKKTFSFLAFK